jgi:hypothetical protein
LAGKANWLATHRACVRDDVFQDHPDAFTLEYVPRIEALMHSRVIARPRHESADECGCRLGGQVASLALLGYLALTIALPLLRGTPVIFSWWWALVSLLGGAMVGKTFGVLRATRLHERKSA